MRVTAPALAVARRTGLGGVALVFAVLGLPVLLVLWRWSGPAPLVDSDTWWYARGALVYSGVSEPDAQHQASVLICVERHPNDPGAATNPACNTYHPVTSPRYARIFTTRPLYPLLVAPLVGWLGLAAALKAVTMACCVAVAAVTFLAVRAAGGGRVAGLVAIVVLFVLPSGFWMSRLSAEAPMMLGLLGVILGWLRWRRGRVDGLAIATCAMAWTFLAKPANGVALALALAVGAAVGWVFDREARRRYVGVLALGVAALVGWWVASRLMQLPGLIDTVQDTATRHFVTPDIPDPWHYLFSKNVSLVKSQAWPVLRQVWPWLLVGIGVASLVARLRWRAIPWLAAGATGVAAVIAHPLSTEYPRLLIPLWLPVAAGLSMFVPGPDRSPKASH